MHSSASVPPASAKGWPLHVKVMLGFILGTLAGLAVHALAADATWVQGVIEYATRPFGQVFLNLLLNAIDALQDSRERQITVTMRYDRAHLRRKDAPPLLDAECVKISIADTGCGIPQDALDQVFTPFFTTKANGSGLGLSVVQGIVSSHNGVIDVSSIPGMGTLFTLTFPLLTAGQPAQRHTL